MGSYFAASRFGNSDTFRSDGPGEGASSAIQGHQFIEQFILSRLEFGDPGQHRGLALRERIRAALRVAVVVAVQRRVRDQRPDAGVVGFVGDLFELGPPRLGLLPERAQTFPDIRQATFDPFPRHARQSRDRRIAVDQRTRARLSSMSRRVILVGLGVLIAALVPGCGETSDACGPVVHDPLDPASAVHVLPGAPPPSYQTDPPTSGAHQPGPAVPGPATEPVPLQVQVGQLEAGRVLIQYHDLGADEVDQLEALDSDEVLVAPAESLPGDTRVAATAWVTHQHCTGVDVEALERFIDHFSGGGPGGH